MNIPAQVEWLATKDFSTYWPNFKKVAYALYDDETVYLFNHPDFIETPYMKVPWDASFAGNTLIEFHGQPTAIVKRADFLEDDALVAALVHEMFHGHQHLLGKPQFPDEAQGVLYPLDTNNAVLRIRERYHLYHAVVPTDAMARQRHLRQFVRCREERVAKLGDAMQYELVMETAEGPAFYVESQAFVEQSDLLYREVIALYGKPLLDMEEAIRHVRKSCYSSGAYLCYVLDRFAPDWKDDFLQKDVTLYELVRDLVDIREEETEPLDVSDELRDLLALVQKERKSAFTKAELAASSQLTLKGNFRIVGLDPMNIVASNNQVLHQNFVRIAIGESTYLFKQRVIAQFDADLFQSNELKILLEEPPEVQGEGVIIQEVGLLRGQYDAESHVLYVPF